MIRSAVTSGNTPIRLSRVETIDVLDQVALGALPASDLKFFEMERREVALHAAAEMLVLKASAESAGLGRLAEALKMAYRIAMALARKEK
jgi:hypothetical protein